MHVKVNGIGYYCALSGPVSAPVVTTEGAHLAAVSPFRGHARVELTLPAPVPVRAALYDVAGRRLAVLADGPHPAGSHRWDWDPEEAGALASSVLFLQVTAGEFRETRKLVHLR